MCFWRTAPYARLAHASTVARSAYGVNGRTPRAVSAAGASSWRAARKAAMAPLLTTDDVGALFRADRATIRRWARNGTLTPIRVGHRMLFDPREVEALIRRAAAATRTAPGDSGRGRRHQPSRSGVPIEDRGRGRLGGGRRPAGRCSGRLDRERRRSCALRLTSERARPPLRARPMQYRHQPAPRRAYRIGTTASDRPGPGWPTSTAASASPASPTRRCRSPATTAIPRAASTAAWSKGGGRRDRRPFRDGQASDDGRRR
jgi:excisionase family DNA binding protein